MRSDALEQELRARGRDTRVFVGMCAWRPFLNDAMTEIAARGIERLVILPLFPQYSVTTTGGGFAALRNIIERRPEFRALDARWVREWPVEPAYVAAFADAVATELAKFPEPERVHLLFSVPVSFVSEHIETLYELDILYKKVAKDAGLPDLRRVPTLNSNPAFIAALANIAERAMT